MSEFKRSLDGISKSVIEKSTAAKLKLENYYKNLMSETIERNKRISELEKKLQLEAGSEERKRRQLQNLGKKEANFLRLKRTRLGLLDFASIKVIGRGAFGEVYHFLNLRSD